MQHPHFESKLVERWNIEIDGTALFRVASTLKNVKKKVKIWNKRFFGNIFERKSIVKDELQKNQERIQKVTLLILLKKKMKNWWSIMTLLLKKKCIGGKI